MKLGIMQPYYFSYIGYWQLMNTVDTYVIYDDVTFIKGGWINRNRILVNGSPNFFNIPIKKVSSHSLIKDLTIDYSKGFPEKELKTLKMAYKKAPYFNETYQLLSDIMHYDSNSLSKFLINQIKVIADYLEMSTEFIVSSKLDKNMNLKGKDKVISICHLLEANTYYNAVGGKSLYDVDEFKTKGIELKFLNTNCIDYSQFKCDFVSNLSIVDVMMFNSKEDVIRMLKRYSL